MGIFGGVTDAYHIYLPVSSLSATYRGGHVPYFKDSSGNTLSEKPNLTPPLLPATVRMLIEIETQVIGQEGKIKGKKDSVYLQRGQVLCTRTQCGLISAS